MKCKNCSSTMPENVYFCPSCGHLSDETRFKNQDIAKTYEQKMISIVEDLRQQQHIHVDWNSTADRYTKVMEQLQFILELPEFKNNADNLLQRINIFFDRCRKPEFHVAFIGTVKAGKSTLINALLGQNLASTSVTPETAVLTKFRHSEGSDYVNVEFYNEAEWSQLWSSISDNADVFKEEYKTLKGEAKRPDWIGHAPIHKEVSHDELEKEVEQWTSSKKVEHYFVKEVEIGLRDFNVPKSVVFVDTPGLDDAVQYRSNVTRAYLDRANAVIACVKASDSMTGHELNTLYRIFTNTSNPAKVHVVGTQWDTLNNPQGGWAEQKQEWVKYLSQSNCYGSSEFAQQNIIHAAAHINNLVRDYEKLSEDERWNLTSIAFKFKIRESELEQKLDVLEELSNIANVRHKVDEIVAKGEEYRFKDIEKSYATLQEDIRKYFVEIKTDQDELLQTANENIETIRAKFEKAKKDLDDLQKYRQQLTNTLKLVSEDTSKRIEALSKELGRIVK